MLYLVGGVPRTGKTIIAGRLLAEASIPYFCLDVLWWGLRASLPEFHLDNDASSVERGRQIGGVLLGISSELAVEKSQDYCLEGDTLLPEHVVELQRRFPGQVRGCFLGFARIAPEQKLSDIRRYTGYFNDWLSGADDSSVLTFIGEAIEFSRYLEAGCAQAGIPYFDTSQDFPAGLDQAVRYLRYGTFEK